MIFVNDHQKRAVTGKPLIVYTLQGHYVVHIEKGEHDKRRNIVDFIKYANN